MSDGLSDMYSGGGESAMRMAVGRRITVELREHPEVRWDRFIEYGGMVRVYGWLDREDRRADFLLLDFDAATGELREWITSAHPHPASVVERLESNSSVECQRVEAHFEIPNAVRLSDPSGEQGEETEDELALRIADAQAVVQTVYDNADEDCMEELESACDNLLGGFFSALDHALRGTQGCLDDDEFAAKRTAALQAHRQYLRLPTPATDPSKEEQCDRPPLGWRCTREPGHDGPCAAVPSIVDRLLRASSKEVGGDGE